MNTTFSDAALHQAAQRLAHQMSAALPAEDAGFSAWVDTRMEPLLRRDGLRRGIGGQSHGAGRGRAVAASDDHGGHSLSVPGLTKRRNMDGKRPDMAPGGLCDDI